MDNLTVERVRFVKNDYTPLDHQQIPTMTDVELEAARTSLITQIDVIKCQLEKFQNGWTPFSEKERWNIRAIDAKRHLTLSLNAIRSEINKRRLAHEATRPRETPEQKAARIAATEANQIEQSRAFVRAAYRILSKREFEEIWDFARELLPEAFSSAAP